MTINGGDGKDYITSLYTNNVLIDGGAGNDKITNSGDNATLLGGAGNDTIYNSGSNNVVIYKSGDGNDIINGFNDKCTLKIGGGTGTCSVQFSGNNVIVAVGEGSIILKGAASLNNLNIDGYDPSFIKLTEGDDNYTNNVDGLKIFGLGGDDTIINSGARLLINGGTDNDFIDNYGSYVSINGGDGDDFLVNRGAVGYDPDTQDYTKEYQPDNVIIVAGNGNDTVDNEGNKITIDGGAGLDSIYNSGANVTVYGGDDNDSIISAGNNVTIIGSTGNDRITLDTAATGNVIQYADGDGKDIVYGFNTTSTLQIGNGTTATYSKATNGDDVILTVGEGMITLVGAASLSTVNILGEEIATVDPTILILTDSDVANQTLDAQVVTADASARTKAIKITANKLANTLLGGGGSDKFWGGAGNDSIVGNAGKDYLNGGTGKDTLHGGRGNDTLNGGSGNDLFIYDAGNDLIMDFEAGDTLRLGDGKATYSKVIDGDDVILTVGEGTITLVGAASLSTLNIAGVYKNPYSIVGTSGADTIANSLSGATINALGGNDSIKNTAASVSVVGGTGKDSITNTKTKVTIDGGTGNDRIVNSAASITITGGKGSDLISLGANAKNNLIIYKDGDGSDTIRGFNTTSTLSIGDGKTDTYYSKPQGDDVIISVGEGKITLTGAASLSTLNIAGKEIIPTLQGITNDDANPLTLNASVVTADASARTKAIKITGNAKANSIVGGSGKDTLGGGKGNDTLTGNGGNDVFIYNAGNDVITDYAKGDTISVASGTATVTEDGNDLILNVGNGSISVAGGKGKTVTYVDAGGSHTYPAPDNDDGVVIDGNTARLTDYTKDSYSIADSLNVTTIDASAISYDLELVGNKKANSILGGIGNDTILGGTGNDYLTGGDGSDVFLYTGGDGNDLITDYTEEDALRINAAISRIAMTTNGTVVFYVDGGRISVAGGANKIIAYEDADGKKHFYPVNFNDKGTAATLLPEYTKDNFDVEDYPYYAGTLRTIDASAVENDIIITANKLVNKILGGAGNDTLIGGKGNDNLTGGKGADVFFYNIGDGDDVITDYTSGKDKIQINLKDISTVLSSATTVDDDIVFKIGEGSITIKDGKEQLITLVDANGKEHFCPDEVKFSDDGATVSLLANYSKDTFDIADYPDYATSVKMINATAVVHDLTITGNSKANTIYGSQTNADSINGAAGDDMLNGSNGDDTLNGGKGNDTLYGGEGNDTFEYTSGDGNDVIADYQAVDVIRITGITEGVWCKDEGDDVIINLGSTNNTIAIRNAARDKTTVTYYVNDRLHAYGGSNDLLIDDNYSADAAQLTNIVEPVKANYVPYDFDAGFDLTRNEIPISYQLKANS